MIIVNPNKYVIFAELNEANHNKDYSVVKTFKVGLVASPFLYRLLLINLRLLHINYFFK